MFSDNDIYEKNSFVDNGAGVAVMFSKQINMNDNLFKDNWGTASYGLLLKEINDSNITNNIFDKNTTAVNIEGSNRLIFKHNNFTNNGWAIKVRGACYANNFTYNNFIFNSRKTFTFLFHHFIMSHFKRRVSCGFNDKRHNIDILNF